MTGAIIGVASAALWLIRDVQYVVGDSRPAEGSLIVNINTATQEELETLPGIGTARAVQIVEGRPYERVDDLVRIPGIGAASLDGLRAFVTTDGETRKR